MDRRSFLKALPLIGFFPASAYAEAGLLIDDPSAVPKPVEIAAVKRPVVFAYSTPGCGPCEQAKREIAAASLPFDVQWKSEAPSWVESFPTFHWQSFDGQWRSTTGWAGTAVFSANVVATSALRFTGRVAGAIVQVPIEAVRGIRDWTWPGNLSSHLCDSHGCRRDSLPNTGRGQIDLHNRLHEQGRMQHRPGTYSLFGRQ